MYTHLLAAASLCAVVLAGPHLDKRQDISAIESSLSVLSATLVPGSSIAAQLTGVPSSVQALQSSPAGLSQLASEFESSVPAWFVSLSPDAQSYVLNAGAARASVFSLEALLTGSATATTTITGVVNGTTATLVPVGMGGSTTASVTGTGTGGNGTVTTGNLSSTSTGTGATTKTTATGESTKTTAKSSSTATATTKASSSSSTAGAAQVTGLLALGYGLVGAAGLAVLGL